MFNRQLNSFVPSVYKDVVEMDDLIRAEQNLVDSVHQEMASAFANTFVLTSNESGVIMFEKILNIMPNPSTDTLEFRKKRILNRLSTVPAFTYTFLKNKLNELIGVDAWKAYIDFNNYTLYVESSSSNQNWYQEVQVTINSIKPCNMVFTNVPNTYSGINISEEISYQTLNWRYRLGSWKLGQTPFVTLDGGGVIKMQETKSIQSSLLKDTANFVASDIASALINGTIEISNLSVKYASDNVVYVEYAVTPEMTNLISDIKLRKADGTVLTQAAVYVPVSQSVVSKHIITVKEG